MSKVGVPSSLAEPGSLLRTLGWAAYLAVSWTWCIGMFLPVLLVRDYGVWGFIVFAVPNVVGAAAMGWVLSRDGMSERLVQRHRPAMIVFSAVTVAFQAFFFMTLLTLHGRNDLAQYASTIMGGRSAAWLGGSAFLGLGLVVLVMAVMGAKRWSEHALRFLAWLVLAGSLICVGVWLLATGPGLAQLPVRSSIGAAWMLPVCLLGFALCPYMDLTFHQARANLRPREARVAFSVGFGVLFFAMILFTLGYATSLLSIGSPQRVLAWLGFAAVALHMGMQTTATSLFHIDVAGRGVKVVVSGIILGGAISIVSNMAGPAGGLIAGLVYEELLYRCFMVFYGLAFPAYVWLAMIPTRDGHAGILGHAGRRKRLVLAAVVGLAMPMYWVGFIEMNEPWLAAGVGVVLLGRMFVGGRGASSGVMGGITARSGMQDHADHPPAASS